LKSDDISKVIFSFAALVLSFSTLFNNLIKLLEDGADDGKRSGARAIAVIGAVELFIVAVCCLCFLGLAVRANGCVIACLTSGLVILIVGNVILILCVSFRSDCVG